MNRHFVSKSGFAVVLVAIAAGCASERVVPSPVKDASSAELKAIQFLQQEVPAWARENGCFSCHNNGDAARVLYAAGHYGYRVPKAALADTTAWLAQPDRWEHNKGDPGFSDHRLANIQFSATLLAAYEARSLNDRAPLDKAARKVAADQEPDGGWHIERHNPVGSPATYGATLATFIAWKTLKRIDAPETRKVVTNAQRWLLATPLNNVPNAAVVLSLTAHFPGESARRAKSIDFLRLAQATDGGWGPYQDSPSEAFDTALALLALSEVEDQREVGGMMERGRAFLFSVQRPDGGWPATTRPARGESYAQQMSTTAWATTALLRTARTAELK